MMSETLKTARGRAVPALLALAVLGGCGGSSPGTEESRDTVLTGVVVSSYGEAPVSGAAASPTVAGATVFLDLNRNLTREANEPESDPTDAVGRFSLPVDRSMISDAQIDQALVVARAASDDAHAQLPVPMAAPAAALRGSGPPREINLITHLVASEMAVIDDAPATEDRRSITPEEAVTRIRESLPALASSDLYAGIASAPTDDALRKTARLVAAKVLAERDAALRRVAEVRARDEAVQQIGGVEPETSVALLATDGTASADSDAVKRRSDALFDQKRAELENEPAAINLADLMRNIREALPAIAPIAGSDTSPTETIEQLQARIDQARAAAEEFADKARAAEREARRLELEARLEEARRVALEAKLQENPGSTPEEDVYTQPLPPEEVEPLPDPARIGREIAAERERLRNLNRVTLIVVFKPKDSLPEAERRDAASRRGEVLANLPNNLRGIEGRVFERAIEGFTVTLPEQVADQFIERMQNHPRVDRVEIDEPVRVRALTTQSPTLSWGVDRSDAPAGLSNSFSWSASGEGITAYIVDTGIKRGSLFGTNQVLDGYTSISDGLGTADCNGHGTHVAGTVASPGYGVAKAASLVPVRVLDCDGLGTLSTVIAGLDWVLGQVGNDPSRASRSVVNLSLGGGISSTLDQAVAKLVEAGITTVVAAGNNADDACNYSPARVRAALTVAASDWNDRRAGFSNFGSCVDLFAPGQSITSIATDGNTARTLSGTSMAAPHVTGAVAQWLQAIPGQTPAEVGARVLAAATPNVVSDPLGSPNRLLFAQAQAGTDAGGGGATEPTPTTVSVGGLTGSAARVSRNGNWRASVSVLIRDASGSAVAGATVTGNFTTGGIGLSCTTGSTGRCTIASGTLSRRLASTTWSIKDVVGPGLQYQSAGNTASSITVSRPN
jgi:subtilisin family serine protease